MATDATEDLEPKNVSENNFTRNQILKNSPEKNEDFFVVPKVVE